MRGQGDCEIDDYPTTRRAIGHFAGRALDQFRLTIHPDRVVEIATHAVITLIAAARAEAAAVACVRVFPARFTARPEGTVGRPVGIVAVSIVKITANGTAHNRAQ